MKNLRIKKFKSTLEKKHHLSRRFIILSMISIMLITTASASFGTYHYYTKSQLLQNQKRELASNISALMSERDILQAALVDSQKNLENSEKSTAKKNQEVKELKKKVKSLNEKIENLNNQLETRPSVLGGSQSEAAASGNIYDRIEVSKKFKPQILRALDLIKANDNHIFSVLNTQVDSIYEMSGCGGFQVKRPIYIGNCGFTSSDVIVAAIIVHETVHVENVYIKAIYSINTKEQELPAYKAQYNFAEKLNAPQWYLDSIKKQIDYYRSLPK